MPGDSYIHQLISITHEIYASFDADPSFFFFYNDDIQNIDN